MHAGYSAHTGTFSILYIIGAREHKGASIGWNLAERERERERERCRHNVNLYMQNISHTIIISYSNKPDFSSSLNAHVHVQ